MAEIEFPDRRAHRRRQRSGIGIVVGVLVVVALVAVLARLHVEAKREAAETAPRVVVPIVRKPPKPAAPKPPPPPERAARMAAIHAALRSGDRVEIQKQMDGLQGSFRQAMRGAAPADLERYEDARASAWSVAGIRAVAWLDRRNLYALVETAALRSETTIDAICAALTPLATPGDIVVNLEFESPGTDPIQLLRRGCSEGAPDAKAGTAPEDAAATGKGKPGDDDPVREESLRKLRDSTPEL